MKLEHKALKDVEFPNLPAGNIATSTPSTGRSRVTAWRQVKAALAAAGVQGDHACPRGLCHGFGVGTLQAAAPLTLVQRWLDHAKLATTAIYTEVSGPEERGFAEAFFAWGQDREGRDDVVIIPR